MNLFDKRHSTEYKEPTAWQNFWWDVEEFLHRNMGWIVAILLASLLLIGHSANAEGIASKPIIQSLEDPTRYVEAWVEQEAVEEALVEEEFCAEPYEGTFAPEGEVDNMAFSVHWFDTGEALREDIGYEYDPLIKAASHCEFKPEFNMAYCDLWLVRPTRVDGDATLSVGHEVLHGLLGDYHE